MMEIEKLPITPVEPNSPIPLYHQIEMDLRHLIESRQLSPDEMLPPEQELCRAYGVGRHTMRMALSRLVADNLIARKAGRGTVVKPPADPKHFYLDRSFTRQIQDMGMRPRTEVLEVATGLIDGNSPKTLQTRSGAPYCRLVRLRYGDDIPLGMQSAHILTELCPGLEKQDFSRYSLYDILNRDYNLLITEIQHTVTARTADAQQAELLHVAVGDALLVVNTTAYVNDHVIIESTTSHYRADRYEFSTTDVYRAR